MSCMTLDSQFLSQVLERLKSQVTFNLPPLQQMAPHMNHRDWGPAAKVFDFM